MTLKKNGRDGKKILIFLTDIKALERLGITNNAHTIDVYT